MNPQIPLELMMHKVDAMGFTDKSHLRLPKSQLKLNWGFKTANCLMQF